MKVKTKNNRSLIAILIVLLIAFIGTTIAYHTSHGDFTNIFRTIFDQWTVTEEFISPNDWQPCQRVPKTITAHNSGNAPIGVRIKYEEYWKRAGSTSTTHDTELPLQIDNQNVAQINLNTSHDWELRDDGYYYFTRPLASGETTSSFIDYVEYNCEVATIEDDDDCTTINGSTTCTNNAQHDYDNAQYHLYATVEITDEPETYNIFKPNKATITYGANLNYRMKSIANPGSSFPDTGVTDSSIRAIKMADELPDNFEPTWLNKFNAYSDEPDIYGWFESETGTFYLYTEADYIETDSDMGWAFQEFRALSDISGLANWRTHKTTKMNSIFNNCISLNDLSPLSKWETSNNTTLGWAFWSDSSLSSSLTNVDGLSNWHTGKTTAINSLLSGATNLTDISGLSDWDVSNVTNMGYLMWSAEKITNLDALSYWQTSKVQYLDNAFSNTIRLRDISGLKDWDTGSLTTLYSTFYNTPEIRSITPLANWDTKNITNMSWLLGTGGADRNEYIGSLSPLKNWDVRKVTEIYGAFYGLTNVSSLDGLQNWQTNSLQNMGWAFANMGDKLTDISQIANWNLSNITSITRVFSGDYSINGSSLNGWAVPSGATMDYAFYGNDKPSWYQG